MLPECRDAVPDVLPQAFLVEERLAAVEVPDIEEAEYRSVFLAAVAGEDQDMFLGGYADSDGVVQDGRSVVSAPVDRIDAEGAWSSDDRLDVSDIADGIVADSHSEVVGRFRSPYVRGCEGVLWRHLVPEDISSHKLAVDIVRHDLEEFDYPLPSLAETGEDQRS